MNIKIGTRGSKLALWQAYHIQDLLEAHGAEVSIVTIETKGDKILDTALSKIGSKGVFTEELEEALRKGEVDIAVHSAKDVQSTLDADLPLIAFTEREVVNDVLVSSNPNLSLKDGVVIGTSSTRRVALLRHFYPNAQIVDMRGNLQTRFKKMESGACEGMLLAYAGVHRMGLDSSIAEKLNVEEFIPPVGQGCVAIQAAPTTIGQKKVDFIRMAVNDTESELCVGAERAYLRQLEGGCSIPVFGNAILRDDVITLKGGIVSLDGQEMIVKELSGKDPETLGVAFSKLVAEAGGDRILKEIKETLKK